MKHLPQQICLLPQLPRGGSFCKYIVVSSFNLYFPVPIHITTEFKSFAGLFDQKLLYPAYTSSLHCIASLFWPQPLSSSKTVHSPDVVSLTLSSQLRPGWQTACKSLEPAHLEISKWKGLAWESNFCLVWYCQYFWVLRGKQKNKYIFSQKKARGPGGQISEEKSSSILLGPVSNIWKLINLDCCSNLIWPHFRHIE